MIQADESVVLFPTSAVIDADGNWRIPLHGWIFEREEDSVWRSGALRLLSRALELDRAVTVAGDSADDTGPPAVDSERAIFRRRALWFLSDNERGKRVALRVGERSEVVGPSSKNGHFVGELTLPAAEVSTRGTTPSEPSQGEGSNPRDRWITVAVEALDPRRAPIEGKVLLLADRGLTVISDLDDTIKVSEVSSKRALLRNTFLREFVAVDGMATAYRRLAERGASFHYLSSSPWHLYPELQRFLDVEPFPPGTIDLQHFRWKDRTFWSLFRSPEKRKRAAIEEFLRRYPHRTVILVGDTAELDPEVYAAIARLHPERVEAIYLRNVTEEPRTHARWSELFAGLPAEQWTVFEDPAVIR
ncbi:MAG: phosphatase domain-containing protein [Planctomycetota bacterium]